MADLLIKGMDMPKDCLHCSIDKVWCDKWGAFEKYNKKRHENCPLVEVPAHGRLVDWDEVEKCIEETADSDIKKYALFLISWAAEKRVVIEASEDGEQEQDG